MKKRKKYQKQLNGLLIIMLCIIGYLLYTLYPSVSQMIETYQKDKTDNESNSSTMLGEHTPNRSFQPGDKQSIIPNKLKWEDPF